MVLALTFDDGPNPDVTLELLHILEAYHAKATFFMVGKTAQKYQEIIQMVARGGHEIGNHSWDHQSFSLLTRRERIIQLEKTARAIEPFGEKIFRPPHGHQTLSSFFDARRHGYKVIGWNAGGRDWEGHDARWISNRIFRLISPGSIILLHDNLYYASNERFADRSATVRALEIILNELADQYLFVTVSELLKLGRPVKEFWYKSPNIDWLKKLKAV